MGTSYYLILARPIFQMLVYNVCQKGKSEDFVASWTHEDISRSYLTPHPTPLPCPNLSDNYVWKSPKCYTAKAIKTPFLCVSFRINATCKSEEFKEAVKIAGCTAAHTVISSALFICLAIFTQRLLYRYWDVDGRNFFCLLYCVGRGSFEV